LLAAGGAVAARLGASRAWAQAAPGGVTPAAPGEATAACIVAPRPNSLWSLAQCCSRNLASNPGCRYFSAADDFIILKDHSSKKPAAYLIIPTMKVTGIEDPQIFRAPVLDFWQYGWREAQRFVGRPAADTALAINSAVGRTQNQLHIHIACVLPEVAQALAENAAKIGSDPTAPLGLRLGPSGHLYLAVATAGLAGSDSPFRIAAAMPGAAAGMAEVSIAVVGSATPGAYYVLETRAGGGNPGAAEELLDQFCR
jgi:CDP-diacylglycerol pyrophosphatase